MWWAYGHFISVSAGTDFRHQNLTSLDVRFWRLKTVPEPKGLSPGCGYLQPEGCCESGQSKHNVGQGNFLHNFSAGVGSVSCIRAHPLIHPHILHVIFVENLESIDKPKYSVVKPATTATTLTQCWASLSDSGPIIKQHWVKHVCLLHGMFTILDLLCSDYHKFKKHRAKFSGSCSRPIRSILYNNWMTGDVVWISHVTMWPYNLEFIRNILQ